MIQIKRNTTVLVELEDWTDGSVRSRQLMDHDYIKVQFTLETPVYFKLGDYIVCDYGRFEITDKSTIEPKHNEDTDGYDYDIRFDSEDTKFKNKLLKYTPENNVSELSFDLTAEISVHVGVLQRNLNALCTKDPTYLYGGQDNWVIEYDTSLAGKSIYIAYNNLSVYDTLTTIADAFECEWWRTDNIFHFGRCENDNEVVDFIYGENVDTMSETDSNKEFATRLYVFGSTRNLPANYREGSQDLTLNGVVQKRLMMPVETPYLQSEGITDEQEAVEAVVIFEDIYPRTQCVVGQVNTYQASVEEEDGTTTTKTFYRVSDTSGFIDLFTEDMILEGETLHIKFESGSLNGMEFECALINKDEVLGKCFEVVVNEDYGRELPDQYLHPNVGDKYILLDWDSTKIDSLNIIPAAEQELREEGKKYLEQLEIDPSNYTCTMAADSMLNVDNSVVYYELGDKVKLINEGFFVNGRTSRIIGFEFNLDMPEDGPRYIVGELATSSRLSKLEGEIEALTSNGNVSIGGSEGGSSIYVIRSGSYVPSTDSNVHSAKRSDLRFLRKDADDIANGHITFNKQDIHLGGTQFGEQFVGGLAGVGGRINEKGQGELESMSLRSWLEVPELRYNRVSVYIGVRWDTFGGGIIEEITPDPNGLETGTGKLKLEGGEVGAIKTGDLCMGIWHDEKGGNASSNSDDNRGNMLFAGFKTVYFQITDVSGANNENFSYTLRSDEEGGNGIHPFVGMHFAGRGSTDDEERQAFTYTTTHYSVALKGVCTWEFQPSNYYEIRGYLEGFSMPAVDKDGNPYTKVFHGYGQVFGNAYIFGQIDEFERLDYVMYIDQSLNGSLAPGETELVTITVKNGYGEDVTSRFTKISVTRTTGDSATDALWNATHTNVSNPFPISFNDLGIDGIHKLLATFNVTATDETTDEQSVNTLDYFS